jgi:hypothetical protein
MTFNLGVVGSKIPPGLAFFQDTAYTAAYWLMLDIRNAIPRPQPLAI